jgi:hypothetical protein
MHPPDATEPRARRRVLLTTTAPLEPPGDAPVKRIVREIPRDARLLNGPQVLIFFGGVSKMWIERRIKDDPGFPAARYICGKRYWVVAELEAWLMSQPREAPEWLVRAGAEGKAAIKRRREAMAANAKRKARPSKPPLAAE